MRGKAPGAMLVVAAVAALGCGPTGSGDDKGGDTTPTMTTYDGTFTGTGGASGTLTFTTTEPVMPAAGAMRLAATVDYAGGSLHLVGAGDVNLTGTFTEPTGPLSLGGYGYAFTGTLESAGLFTGTWMGPSGTGGAFTALRSGGGFSVTRYCGTFGGSDGGAWNLGLQGPTLSGSLAGTTVSGVLAGTLSNTSIDLAFPGGTATGTFVGPSMNGTWTSGAGGGSWQASNDGCY